MKIKNILFVFSSVILLFPSVVCAGDIDKDTYGVLSENFSGAIYVTTSTHINPKPGDYVNMFKFTDISGKSTFEINTIYAASTIISTPEGMKFIETYPNPESTSTWSGWGISYVNVLSSTTVIPKNMSDYYQGKLKFVVRSSSPTLAKNATIRIKIKDVRTGASGYIDAARTLSSMGYQENTNWQELEFNLSGTVDGYKNGSLVSGVPINADSLAETEFLFMFVYVPNVSSDVKVDIDNIRWEKQSVPILEVKMKNNTGSDYSGNVSFGIVERGSTKWKVAEQYFEVNLNDMPLSPSWIQVYTDNMNASASPRYTGIPTITNSPAGLVDVSTTTVVLPMCLRVSTQALSVDKLVIYQNNEVLTDTPNSGYRCYLWMQDVHTKDKNTGNDIDFVTDKYSRIWNHGTIAETDTENGRGVQYKEATFGGYSTSLLDGRTPMFPICVYIGADFSSRVKVLKGHVYTTSMLTIELIYE